MIKSVHQVKQGGNMETERVVKTELGLFADVFADLDRESAAQLASTITQWLATSAGPVPLQITIQDEYDFTSLEKSGAVKIVGRNHGNPFVKSAKVVDHLWHVREL
jgi:hypothetical protein